MNRPRVPAPPAPQPDRCAGVEDIAGRRIGLCIRCGRMALVGAMPPPAVLDAETRLATCVAWIAPPTDYPRID